MNKNFVALNKYKLLELFPLFLGLSYPQCPTLTSHWYGNHN